MEDKKLSGKRGVAEKNCDWITKRTSETRHPIIKFHNEMIDFTRFATPSALEKEKRELVISRVTEVAHQCWPDSEVKLFGSFATDLAISSSDIDLVVLTKGEPDADPAELIKRMRNQLFRRSMVLHMIPIFHAKVPILKFTERETHIKVDISFNLIDGYCAVEPVKALIAKYPPLRPLTLALKAFLVEKNFHETFHGGIGSFLLVLMVTGYIQYYIRESKRGISSTTLGELLLGFLDFYGQRFNVNQLGISVIGKGTFYKKATEDELLSVENPQDPDLDIGRPATQMSQIRAEFLKARQKLLLQPSLASIISGTF